MTDQTAATRFRRYFRWFCAIQFVAIIGVAVYFLGRVNGYDDQRTQADAIAEDGNMVAPAGYVSQIAIQPPQDYLNLCIVGYQAKLFRLPDTLEAAGKQVSWTRNGEGWVLDAAWYDNLTKADRTLSIAFDRTEMPAQLCVGSRGYVAIDRVAIDGLEVPPQQAVYALNEWIGDIGDKDIIPIPTRRAPIPSAPIGQSPAAPATMNGGDTYGRGAEEGAANIDGTPRSGGD